MSELRAVDLVATSSDVTVVRACVGGSVLVDRGDVGQLTTARLGVLDVVTGSTADAVTIDRTGLLPGADGALVVGRDAGGRVTEATAIRYEPGEGAAAEVTVDRLRERLDLMHEFTPWRFVAVPGPDERLDGTWFLLASTFDGYLRFGGFDECAEAADLVRSGDPRCVDDLAHLRAELFFSARAARHGGLDLDADVELATAVARIRELSGGVVRTEHSDAAAARDLLDGSAHRSAWP